jgi:hypothetical protein
MHSHTSPAPTCVKVMPLDRAVGMQQNTPRPSARAGGCSGSCTASRPNSGVTSRMDSSPHAIDPAAVEATAAGHAVCAWQTGICLQLTPAGLFTLVVAVVWLSPVADSAAAASLRRSWRPCAKRHRQAHRQRRQFRYSCCATCIPRTKHTTDGLVLLLLRVWVVRPKKIVHPQNHHHHPPPAAASTPPHLYDEDASGGQCGYLQVGCSQAQLGEADTQQQRTQQRKGQEVRLRGRSAAAAHSEGVVSPCERLLLLQ